MTIIGRMQKTLLLSAAFCLSSAAAASGEKLPEPFLDFDFSHAAGLQKTADRTGRSVCVSASGPFVVQDGGLRIAEGARFYIPGDKLPDMTEHFTATVWLSKNYFADISAVLFRGVHSEPLQFMTTISMLAPEFRYKNVHGQSFYKGAVLQGNFRSTTYQYNSGTRIVSPTGPALRQACWTHVAWVFDRGAADIYINGRLTVSHRPEHSEKLIPCTLPMWLGAERVPKLDLNYATGNLLLNDLHIYREALTASEVEQDYQLKRTAYPEKSLLKPGEVKYPDCNAYLEHLMPGIDPDFRKKLPMTAEFEKNLPKPLPPGHGNTVSKVAPDRNGVPGLFINNREYYPFLFFPWLVRDNRYRFSDAVPAWRDFAAAGLELFGTGYIPPLFWNGPGKYSFAQLDEVVRRAAEAHPAGRLQVYLYIRPHGWFFSEHRRELELYYPSLSSKGQLSPFYLAAPFGSKIWLEIAPELICDTVRHMESQDYADRIYAYQLGCGDAGEWYWSGSFTGGVPGYSEATRSSFSEYLKRLYRTDKALQEAWNDRNVTFANVRVPSPEFRLASEHGDFRDPVTARPVLDFRRYMNDITFANLEAACRAAKRGCGGKKIVSIYHGYPLLYAGWRNTMHWGGLGIFGRVLGLDCADGIATPLNYEFRRGGDSGANINAFNGSARLHGKLLWHENDLRTHLHPVIEFGRTADMRETIEVMRRGFGWSLVQDAGFWYCILTANYTFHHPDIMNEVRRIAGLSREAMLHDRRPNAEAALVFDEESTLYTSAPRNDAVRGFTWGMYGSALRAGAPFDVYLLDDIGNPKMPDYKIYVFMNSYYMTAERREKILAKLHRNHAVAVWCHAPGLLSERGFDPEAMTKLTGFRFVREDSRLCTSLKLAGGMPFTRRAAVQKKFSVQPWFHCVPEKGVGVAGTLAGRPALAVKKMPDFTSVYLGAPPDWTLLAGLYELAGVHLYSASGDVFAANSGYIMLHTSTAGDKTLFLPRPAKVTEIFSGRQFGPVSRTVTDCGVPAGTTRIYRLE